jgi:hypothetical protein
MRLAVEIVLLLIGLTVIGFILRFAIPPVSRVTEWLTVNTTLFWGALGVAALSLLWTWAKPNTSSESDGLGFAVVGVCLVVAAAEVIGVLRRDFKRLKQERDDWKDRALDISLGRESEAGDTGSTGRRE